MMNFSISDYLFKMGKDRLKVLIKISLATLLNL